MSTDVISLSVQPERIQSAGRRIATSVAREGSLIRPKMRLVATRHKNKEAGRQRFVAPQRHVANMQRKGLLPYLTLGRRVIFERSRLMKALDEITTRTAAEVLG